MHPPGTRPIRDPDDILTIDEAAAVARCHPETIRRYIRDGAIPYLALSREHTIRRCDLDAFLSEQTRLRKP